MMAMAIVPYHREHSKVRGLHRQNFDQVNEYNRHALAGASVKPVYIEKVQDSAI